MSDTYFLIVGILLVVFGVLLIIGGISANMKCNTLVKGVIVNLIEKSHYHRGIITHEITPVVRYTYNGRKYEKKSEQPTRDTEKYRIDDSIDLLINPDMPEEFLLHRTIFPFVMAVVLMLPGLLLIYCYFL